MNMNLKYEIKNGVLYNEDVLNALDRIEDDSVDLVFADPPFNLNKVYDEDIDDKMSQSGYLDWSYCWIEKSVDKLKDGGAFFLWNIPKWNTYFSAFLNTRLNFRNWISVEFKVSMPIKGRLYPSHYSLLYYIRGERPRTFIPDRLPLEVCSSCHNEMKDYGGYKSKLNPKGLTLPDVWNDIYPVRHKKYKNREANQLPIKLIDRIIQMSSIRGDTILDIFSGSGSTLVTAELKDRHWIGIEKGDIDIIKNRFEDLASEFEYLQEIRSEYNSLFTKNTRNLRIDKGIWVNDITDANRQ